MIERERGREVEDTFALPDIAWREREGAKRALLERVRERESQRVRKEGRGERREKRENNKLKELG